MFWLQRTHISFEDLWEHVDFKLLSTYDVVGAPQWEIAMENQPWTEIWLIREGRCTVVQGEREATARAGEAVVLQAGQSRRTFEPDGAPISIIGFAGTALLAGGIDFLPLLDLPLCLQPDSSRFGVLLTQLIEESRERRFGYTFAVQGLAQLALVELLRCQPVSTDATRTLKARQRATEKFKLQLSGEILQTLQFIHANFATAFDVADLARAAHLSPKHFNRKFKEALGVPPMEYVRRFRLQQAAQRLEASDEAIAVTAAGCGFEDAAHFSRAFKAQFGMAPLAYKQHQRTMAATRIASLPANS